MIANSGGLETFFRFVVESSVGACVVVMTVLLLQKMFPKRLTPRWRCLLWSLLIARLLLPWTPTCPLSASSLWKLVSPGISFNTPSMSSIPIPQREMTIQSVMQDDTMLNNEKAIPTPAEQTRWHMAIDRVNLFRAIWLIGCLAFGLRVLVSLRRFTRSLQNARPIVDSRILTVFEACKIEMKWRGNVTLLISPLVHSPLICGVFSPSLIFPERQLHTLSDGELRHIFLHELGHLKRGDLLMGFFTSVLQAIHWFNPLVWYGFYRMRQDREFACDALVLSHIPETESNEYGHTLIRLMEERGSIPRFLTAVNIVEHKSQLKRRLEMITQHKSNTYRLTWFGLVLFAVCAVVLLTQASATPVFHKEPDVITVLNQDASKESTDVRLQLAQSPEKASSGPINIDGQNVPTPDEFLAILKAHKGNYSSATSKSIDELFYFSGGKVQEKPRVRATQDAKWKSEYHFISDDVELFNTKLSGEKRESIKFCNRPEQSRWLLESPGLPQGIIDRVPFEQANQPNDPINLALGDTIIGMVEAICERNPTVRREGDNLLILEGSDAHGNSHITTLDKRYGFMIISLELKSSDGKIIFNFTYDDFKEINKGMWLPFSCNRFYGDIESKGRDRFHKIKILDLKINPPISDEEFQLVFPKGTYVRDKISGTSYMLGEKGDMANYSSWYSFW